MKLKKIIYFNTNLDHHQTIFHMNVYMQSNALLNIGIKNKNDIVNNHLLLETLTYGLCAYIVLIKISFIPLKI